MLTLAASQHGVVTWPELVAMGLGHRAVAHRVARRRLYRVHHGVYLLEPPETANRFTILAAGVHACGEGAFLSHLSAAELWGLLPGGMPDIHVTVVGRNPGVRRKGIRVHRSRALDPRDRRSRHGIRLTAPARTALDLAPWLAHPDLERLLASARVGRLASERELSDVLRRYPTHRGAAALKAVLRRVGGPALTRSEAEQRMLDLVREARLPRPRTNLRLSGYEVDFLWRPARLVVETDGYAFHADRAAFERDRERDAALVAAGFRVIRVTWRQIVEEPLVVVGRIARALGTN